MSPADAPEGTPAAQDGEPNEDELARRRAERGDSLASQAEPDAEPELPLNLPGTKPGKSSLKGARKVSVEGKLMGASVKQLGGQVTDPDQIIELRVLARLEKNVEVPVRDGSDETAHTQSATLRQHFRVLRIEVLSGAGDIAAEG